MAMAVSEIQRHFRFYANARDESLTTEDGLARLNAMYFGLCVPYFTVLGVRMGRRWPEFYRSHDIATVATQADYAWPTSPVFASDEYNVEYIRASDGEVIPLVQTPNLAVWGAAATLSDDEPEQYRLYHNGTAVKLALRPAPDTTGDTIRINGVVEPTALGAGDSTAFLSKNTDLALAMLLAADYKAKRGEPDTARGLLASAEGLLPRYDRQPSASSDGVITGTGL